MKTTTIAFYFWFSSKNDERNSMCIEQNEYTKNKPLQFFNMSIVYGKNKHTNFYIDIELKSRQYIYIIFMYKKNNTTSTSTHFKVNEWNSRTNASKQTTPLFVTVEICTRNRNAVKVLQKKKFFLQCEYNNNELINNQSVVGYWKHFRIEQTNDENKEHKKKNKRTRIYIALSLFKLQEKRNQTFNKKKKKKKKREKMNQTYHFCFRYRLASFESDDASAREKRRKKWAKDRMNTKKIEYSTAKM